MLFQVYLQIALHSPTKTGTGTPQEQGKCFRGSQNNHTLLLSITLYFYQLPVPLLLVLIPDWYLVWNHSFYLFYLFLSFFLSVFLSFFFLLVPL